MFRFEAFGDSFLYLHRSGWEPEARLLDQNRDGIAPAEVQRVSRRR